MSKQLNFAQQMDEVLKTLGPQRPKLLLHACCGPCSSAVLEKLCRYFEITVLYYNPNTWPAEEYYRRGERLGRECGGYAVDKDNYTENKAYFFVPFGADEELADPAQLAPGGEVLFLHARDAEAGDLLLLHRRAEGEVRAEHQLAPRVVALHVRSGIGLGVTERLRLAQTGGIIDAGGRHG